MTIATARPYPLDNDHPDAADHHQAVGALLDPFSYERTVDLIDLPGKGRLDVGAGANSSSPTTPLLHQRKASPHHRRPSMQPTIAKRLLSPATGNPTATNPASLTPTKPTTDTPADTRHGKLCGCRVPLIWDRDDHHWLHLNPRTPCPKRRAQVDPRSPGSAVC